ncbi:MAG TPA: PilZ domain-containing protein [Terriglobales bacterium]|nr:PilZ domain-containing protein [Terriglobales bacterium]
MDDKRSVAPRFSLKLPMRYRPTGDLRWRNTETKNVSSSGVLFLAAEPLQPGRKLEIEILMMPAAPLKACRMVTTSEVVRQSSTSDPLLTAVRHLQWQTHATSEQAQAPASH